MLRFAKNRWWWTLILALTFSLTSLAITNHPCSASDGPSITSDPGSTTTGDPDQPTGPGKQSVGRGRSVGQPVYTFSRTPATVGDGGLSSMPWMVRLLVIVRGLRSFYFRF